MSGPWGKPKIYDPSSTNLVHRGTGISAFVSKSNSAQSSSAIKYRPGDWKNSRPLLVNALQRCSSVSQLQRPANKRPQCQIQRSSSGFYNPHRFTSCVNSRPEPLRLASQPATRSSSNYDVSNRNLRRSGSVSILSSKHISPPRKMSTPAPRPLSRSGSTANIPVRPLSRSGSTGYMSGSTGYMSGSTGYIPRSNIGPLSRSMSSASVAKRNLTRSGAPNISAEFLRKAKVERKKQEEAEKYVRREERREERIQRMKKSRERREELENIPHTCNIVRSPSNNSMSTRSIRANTPRLTPGRLVREKTPKSEQHYQYNRTPDDTSSSSSSPLSSITGWGLPRNLEEKNKAEKARLLRLKMTKRVAGLKGRKEGHVPGEMLSSLDHKNMIMRVSPHRLLNKPRQKRDSATTITSEADYGGSEFQHTSKMFSDADSDATECDSDFDDIVMRPDHPPTSLRLRRQSSPVGVIQQLRQQPENPKQYPKKQPEQQPKKRPMKQYKQQPINQPKQLQPICSPEQIKFPVPRPMTYEDRYKLDKIRKIAFELDRPLTAAELYAFYKDPVMKPMRRDRGGRGEDKENRVRPLTERLGEWMNVNRVRGSNSERSQAYTDDDTPMNSDQEIGSSRASSPSRKISYDSMTGRRISFEISTGSEEDKKQPIKKPKKSKRKEYEASLKPRRESTKKGIIKINFPKNKQLVSNDNSSTSNDIITEEIFPKTPASKSSLKIDTSTLEDTTPLNSSPEESRSTAPSETPSSWIVIENKLNNNIIDAFKKGSTPDQLDSGFETTEPMLLSGDNTPEDIDEIPINETEVIEDQMKELKMTVELEQEVGLHVDLALQSDIFQNVFYNRTSSKPIKPANYALKRLERHEKLITESDMDDSWISLESGGPSFGTSSGDEPLVADVGSKIFLDAPTEEEILGKEESTDELDERKDEENVEESKDLDKEPWEYISKDYLEEVVEVEYPEENEYNPEQELEYSSPLEQIHEEEDSEQEDVVEGEDKHILSEEKDRSEEHVVEEREEIDKDNEYAKEGNNVSSYKDEDESQRQLEVEAENHQENERSFQSGIADQAVGEEVEEHESDVDQSEGEQSDERISENGKRSSIYSENEEDYSSPGDEIQEEISYEYEEKQEDNEKGSYQEDSVDVLSDPSHDPDSETYDQEEGEYSSSYYENEEDYSDETYSEEANEEEEERKLCDLHKRREPIYSNEESEYTDSYVTEEASSTEEKNDPQPYHSAYARSPFGRHSPEQANSNALTIKPIRSTLSESTRLLLEKRQRQSSSDMNSLNQAINSILINNHNHATARAGTAPAMVMKPSFAALMAHSNKNKAQISSSSPSTSDRSKFTAVPGPPVLEDKSRSSFKPSVGSFKHESDTPPIAVTGHRSVEPLKPLMGSLTRNKMKSGIAFTVDLNGSTNDSDSYC